jgi:WD40 repeat protein
MPARSDANDFEGFRIIRALGTGGMGIVYLAEQLEPVRRTVALKVIKVGRETEEFLARFEAERQALALMDHPSIARVFDAGTSRSGRPYFVMEYIPGIPITQYCDEKNLGTAQRVELFRQVCLAVQHAHQKGVIHRDLKPGNVLIMEQDGVPLPKVIDFGLVKAFGPRLTPDTLLTEYGLVLGTPAYMSPEVASLDASELDTRSDVYSLGVMLYELLVGALPFDTRDLKKAGLAEILRIIREEEPPRLSIKLSSTGDAREIALRRNTDISSLRRQLSGDLEWIVLRVIEKDPRRRYASASEFAADIQNHLRDQPITARPPRAAYVIGKFLRRHRVPVTAAAAVLVAIVAGLIVSTGLYFRAEQDRRTAEDQRAEAERQRAEAERQRAAAVAGQRIASEQRTLAEKNARAAEDSRIHAEREGYKANISAAELHLRQIEFVESRAKLFLAPRNLRGWEWQYFFARTDNTAKRLFASSDWMGFEYPDLQLGEADPPRRVAFSQDGAQMFWNMDLAVHSFRYPSLETSRVYQGLGRIVALTQDGSQVFTVSRTGDPVSGAVIETQTGRTVSRMSGHPARILLARFSADKRRLVTTDRGGNILVWDAATGRQIARTELRGPVRCLAVDPTGSLFTAATRTGDIGVYDANTGAKRAGASGHTNSCRAAAFSADGKRIVTGSSDHTAKVWDASNGALLASASGHLAPVVSAGFSPDGKMIVTGSEDRTVRVWRATNGQPLYSLAGLTEQALPTVVFTPDGRRIICGVYSGELLVWDAEAASTSMLRPSQPVIAADLSRDGAVFAVITANLAESTALSLWDSRSGQIVSEGIGGGRLRSIALAPDKRMAATAAVDGTIQLWDVARKTEILRMSGHKGLVLALAFSPNGAVLASGGNDNTLRLWDVRSGRALAQVELPNPINSVRFSPDGRRLASGSGAIFIPERNAVTVRLWDARNLAPIAELPFRKGHDQPAALQTTFSPDGKLLVAGEAFGLPGVFIWDAASGKLLRELKGHQTGVTGVGFSADGQRLFSYSSPDGQLRVWDPASGEMQLALSAPRGVNYTLAAGPPGTSVYSIGANRPIQAWVTTSAYHPDAVAALDRLSADSVLRSEVEEALKSQAGLDSAARKSALQLVSGIEDAHTLYERVILPNIRQVRSHSELLESLRLARIAVRRTPLSNTAWDALALVQYRLGQHREAIGSLEKARGIAEPDEMEMILHALARAKLGDAAAARQHLDQVNRLIQRQGVRRDPNLAVLAKEGAALQAPGQAAPAREVPARRER